MKNYSAQLPFRIPSFVTPEKRVDYCIDIINKYRNELPLLRRKTSVLENQLIGSWDEIKYWREKYQETHEELKRIKRENGKLKKDKNRLEKEVEKMTKTNNRYSVALFDHGNFKHKDDQNKKNKGGQAGHPDTNREKSEDYSSYTKERLFVKTCGKCGHNLSRVNATRQKILLDIVLNPQTVKLILESERQWCGNCQSEVNAKDVRSLPFTEYGINTFMMVVVLRFKCHASFENTARVITISHGLKLSKSDVSNILKQASKYLGKKYEELKDAVRKGEVMYNDETGWMVNGQSAWMWIMANENITVYFASESRGKGIAEEIYGNSQSFCMHDGLPSYQNSIPKDKQCYCWAHFLRFAYEETILEKEGSIPDLLKEELVDIYHLKFNHPEYSLQQLEKELRERLNKVLQVSSTSQSIINIQTRLKVQKEGLINSLLYTPDGTNNLSERELRTMVINKKISNGSKTYKGMETSAVIGSVVQTLSRKEEDLIPNLKNYLLDGIREKYKQYSHTTFYNSS